MAGGHAELKKYIIRTKVARISLDEQNRSPYSCENERGKHLSKAVPWIGLGVFLRPPISHVRSPDVVATQTTVRRSSATCRRRSACPSGLKCRGFSPEELS